MSSIAGAVGSVSVTTQTTYHLTAPTLSDGAVDGLEADSKGNLYVNPLAPSVTGQKTMANSLAVVLSSDQSNLPANLTQIGGVAVATGNGVVGTGVQRVAIASDNTPFGIKLNDGSGTAVNVGQGLMAASLPVVIASNQSAIPASQSGAWSMRLNDGAGTSVTVGSTVSAGSLPVVIASDQVPLAVKIEDSAGTSITLGAKVGNSSLPVVLASDQAAIPVNQNSTWTVRLFDGGGTSVTVGQKAMASSLPVVLASDQPALSTTQSYVSVKNFMDTNQVLDASITGINGNAGAFVQVVATLGNACKKIRVADTTGRFIGVYTGAAASEALAFIINPGMDDYIEHAIAATTRITLRAIDNNTAIATGNLVLQFSA